MICHINSFGRDKNSDTIIKTQSIIEQKNRDKEKHKMHADVKRENGAYYFVHNTITMEIKTATLRIP